MRCWAYQSCTEGEFGLTLHLTSEAAHADAIADILDISNHLDDLKDELAVGNAFETWDKYADSMTTERVGYRFYFSITTVTVPEYSLAAVDAWRP